jgi:hypothetical protein
MMNRGRFFDICAREFSFLETDFGFRVVAQDSSDVSLTLSLKNSTTGIRVSYEFRECYVFVKICRLLDDNFAPAPGELRPDTILYCYDLDDLLSVRSPESIVPSYQPQTVLNDELVESVISQQAKNLRQYAQDLLQGDFSIFEKLDKIVKERAREAAFRKWGPRASEYDW